MGKTQILCALGLALALGVLGGNYTYAEGVSSAGQSAATSATMSVNVSATGQVTSTASVSQGATAMQGATSATAAERSAGSTNNVTAAANYAESVLQETKNVTNNEPYPGVRNYLQGLVGESKKPENQGSQALADALNEGALATSLLMGTYNKQSAAKTSEPATASARSATTYAMQNGEAATDVTLAQKTQNSVLTTQSMNGDATQSVENGATQLAESDAVEQMATAQLANATIKVTVANSTDTEKDAELEKDESEVAEALNEDEIEVPKTGELKTNFGVLAIAGVGVVAVTLGATAVVLRSRKNA